MKKTRTPLPLPEASSPSSTHHNISPHIYVASTLGTALLFFGAFLHWGFQNEYFFAPIFTLAAIYGLINFRYQSKGLGDFKINPSTDFRKLLKRSLARFLVWLPIFYIAAHAYRMAPYFGATYTQPTLYFFDMLFKLYLVCGLPYFLLTLKFKSSHVEDFFDPAVRIIHMLKQILYRILPINKKGSPLRAFKNRYNRKVLLNFLIRAYFMPVMVHQVYINMERSVSLANSQLYSLDLLTILFLLTTMLWLCDVINASVAYCLESRWLENRTRSIDLTLSGWAVCMFCYYPLNYITSSAFPFAYMVVNNNPNMLVIPQLDFLYAVKIMEVLLLALHVYINTSLGISGANLSLKKLQTRGAYGIIRHPGTVSKLTFWLLISSCYTAFWSLPMILGQLAWSGLYILRALTEERHLRQHEEYREYMKKVRYRFIPGLI